MPKPTDETVLETPASEEGSTPPETNPDDDIRGLIFGDEEERARILAKPFSGGPDKKPDKPEAEENKEAEDEEAAPVKAPKAKAKAAPAKPSSASSPDHEKEEKKEEVPEESAPGKPKPPRKLSTEELLALQANSTREAVVAGVREAVASQPRAEAPPPAAPKTAVLPDVIRKNMEALRVLSEIKPEKFRDIENRAVDFWDEKSGELARYKKKWLKDNPGETFDIEDEVHADWMEENEPFVSEEDLEAAREEVLRRKLRAEVQQEMEPMRRKIAEREAEASSAPVIQHTLNSTIKELLGEVNPNLKEVPEQELFADLAKKDPVANVVMSRTAPTFVPIMAETVKIFAGKPYDHNNPLHRQIDQYAVNLETSLANQTPEQTTLRTPDGHVLRFATRAQLQKVPPNQRGHFWTVNRDVILESLKRDWRSNIAASYSEYQSLLTQLNGGSPPQSAVPNKRPTASKGADNEEIEEESPPQRSPAFRSASPAPPPRSQDDPANAKPGDSFFTAAGW